ncbi:MAG TPA: hypothetical protein VMA09_09585 [Candidatus Binataceae bacterium]|nr:hypothetical protein [Candidatus Binataceae bacterium]
MRDEATQERDRTLAKISDVPAVGVGVLIDLVNRETFGMDGFEECMNCWFSRFIRDRKIYHQPGTDVISVRFRSSAIGLFRMIFRQVKSKDAELLGASTQIIHSRPCHYCFYSFHKLMPTLITDIEGEDLTENGLC